jgi:hypothetical protein
MKPTQNQNSRSRIDILFAAFRRGMAPALDQNSLTATRLAHKGLQNARLSADQS